MTVTAGAPPRRPSRLRSRIGAGSRLRGYLLLLPVLLFVGLSLLYPLGLLLLNSFWRQEGMDVVADFTFGNYAAFLAFGVRKHKALWLLAVTIPFWTTICCASSRGRSFSAITASSIPA